MKLYHGTTRERAERIWSEGLKASSGIRHDASGRPYIDVLYSNLETGKIYMDDVKGKEHLMPKFVYFWESEGLARQWGEMVFEVESETLDQSKLTNYREGLGMNHPYLSDVPANLLTLCRE